MHCKVYPKPQTLSRKPYNQVQELLQDNEAYQVFNPDPPHPKY